MKNATSLLLLLLSLLAHGCSSESTSFYSICEDGMPTAGLSGMLIMAGLQGAVCEDDPPKQSLAYQQTATDGFEDCRRSFAQVEMLDDSEFHKQFEQCRSAKSPSQWVWVCIAAHRQYPEAQDQMGQHYFWGYEPVEQEYVQAYKWSLLAARNRDTSNSAYLAMMRPHVTSQQVTAAQRLAADWLPHEAQCNSVELQSDN